LVLLCYHDTLRHFFTAPDTLSLIDTGRVGSLKDIARILSEPLMNGTGFAEGLRFFRPVAVFSYSIDYAIWGLNPVGYHVTNLLIHALVSLLLFVLVRKLTGSIAAALVSSVIFCIHPVHVENIPAIARRHDALAMLYLLASLIALPVGTNAATGKRWALSLLFCALALCSKESALISPLVVTAYMWCVFGERGMLRARRTALASIPYWVLAGLFFNWRVLVLGGVGGDLRTSRAPYAESAPRILEEFSRGLVDPYQVFGHGSASIVPVLAAAVLLVWFIRSTIAARRVVNLRTVSGPVGFFLVWLWGGLIFFLAVSAFEIRHLYMPLISFSAITGIGLVAAVRRFLLIRGMPVLLRGADAISIVVVGVLLGSLIGMSPALRTYPDWKAIGRMSSMFLEDLTHAAPGFSPGTSVHIEALPWRVSSYLRSNIHVRTAGGLLDYSIQSWVNMKHPGSELNFTISWIQVPEIVPEYLFLTADSRSESLTKVRVTTVFAEPDGTLESLREVGNSYRGTGDYECGIYYLSLYLRERSDDADAWTSLAYGYALTGEEGEAETIWLTSLDANAGDVMAIRGLTNLYRDQHKSIKAAKMAALWIDADPTSPEAYQAAGWTAFNRKRRKEAMEFFKQALDIESSMPAHRGLVMVYFADKRYEQAFDNIEDWLDYDRGSKEAFELGAKCLEALGRDEDLITFIDRARANNAVTLAAAEILSNAYIRMGRVPDAELVLRTVAEEHPDSAFVRSRVAELNAWMGECEIAKRWLAEAIDRGLDPTRARVVRRRIQSCDDLKERRQRNR
ncbi:MAG: hypothetical protein O7D32_09125, partial [bacterium]|nr:hypothetical protein [bacterium]